MRLSAQLNCFRRSSIEEACGLLAREGDCLRPILQHLLTESRDVDGEVERRMIHSRTGLAHVGETNAEVQQARKLMRLILAWGYPGLVDGAPKAIAGMSIIMTDVG